MSRSKHRRLSTTIHACGWAAALAAVPVAAAPPRHPFPQNLSYAAGSLTPDHRPAAQLDDDVRIFYWQWRADYLVQAGTEPDGHPRYRVKTGTAASEPTVSEGQGYGMVIVALMAGEDPDAQTVFDGLWEFLNDHRSEIDSRLMDWYVPADETPQPGDDDSAFDGDCDIAYALLLAAEQWGNGDRIDYRSQLDDVLAGIAESTIGPQSDLPMLGDWVEPAGVTYNQYTPRSSDLIVGHFRAFRRATGDPLWNDVAEAATAVVETLQTGYSPLTGLLPDFVVPMSASDHSPRPAPPDFLEGPHDGHYYYNAGRDPWRIATAALIDADPSSAEQARRMVQWIRVVTGGDPFAVRAGYELDGTVIGDDFTSFFASPFGVAAMVDPGGQTWLNAVWEAVRTSREGYYEDSVTLLSMLVMSHDFWDPTTIGEIFRDGFESGTTDRWSVAVP